MSIRSMIKACQSVALDLDGTLFEVVPYQDLMVVIGERVGTEDARGLLGWYQFGKFPGHDKARAKALSMCGQDEVLRAHVNEMYDAWLAGNEDVKLMPYALEVIQLLQQAEHEVWIWSKGDPEGQRRRAKKASITELVGEDRIIVVSSKVKPEDLAAIEKIERPLVVIDDQFPVIRNVVENGEQYGIWIRDAAANKYHEPPTEVDLSHPRIAVASTIEQVRDAILKSEGGG